MNKIIGYVNGLPIEERSGTAHDPSNGQFTSSGSSGKTTKKLSTPDEAGHFLGKVMDSHFPEAKWVTGQCANLALGVSKFLTDHGIHHELQASKNFDHVAVKVGKHRVDGSHPSGRVHNSGWHKIDPKDLVGKILVTPKRVDEVHKTLTKVWKSDPT